MRLLLTFYFTSEEGRDGTLIDSSFPSWPLTCLGNARFLSRDIFHVVTSHYAWGQPLRVSSSSFVHLVSLLWLAACSCAFVCLLRPLQNIPMHIKTHLQPLD
eukprot:RCo016988